MTTPTERRLAITPGTNIRWERSYGIGRKVYWCLVSDESIKEDKCLNAYTILFASCDNDMGGQPLNEQPDLVLYADAHNVYNSCHLTPSELLVKLREAQDVVVHMVSAAKYHFKHGNDTNLDKQTDIADAFLSNLNLPK